MASLPSRVFTIYNHTTSMRLAPAECEALKTICHQTGLTRKQLFELIETHKAQDTNLTTSVRLFAIIYFRNLLIWRMKELPDTSKPNFIKKTLKEISN